MEIGGGSPWIAPELMSPKIVLCWKLDEKILKHCPKLRAISRHGVGYDNVDIKFLKEKKTYMISIEAPIEIRYERIKSRQKSTDFIDLETFKQQCETESKGKSSGQNIEEAMKLSDFHIENDGNISEFYSYEHAKV